MPCWAKSGKWEILWESWWLSSWSMSVAGISARGLLERGRCSIEPELMAMAGGSRVEQVREINWFRSWPGAYWFSTLAVIVAIASGIGLFAYEYVRVWTPM